MNTKIRKLSVNDAPRMFSWMNDKSAIKGLNESKFINKTIDDCINFIVSCNNDRNIHFAITDLNDKYIGTISLKNINLIKRDAELAIIIMPSERGKKHSEEAIKQIIKIAKEKGLTKIYLYVKSNNVIAKKAYEKTGFAYKSSKDDEKMDYYELQVNEVIYE